MIDGLATAFAIGLLFIVLPAVLLLLRDRVATARRRRSRPTEEQSREQRLLNPDWACVERCLGRPVPGALRDLYADAAFITRRDMRWSDECAISSFEPLDAQAMAAAKEWLGFAAVAIATTDLGDTVYLRCGASERDTVYLTHHDGGDTAAFAESVALMHATLTMGNLR
jgi:hypothetical protein